MTKGEPLPEPTEATESPSIELLRLMDDDVKSGLGVSHVVEEAIEDDGCDDADFHSLAYQEGTVGLLALEKLVLGLLRAHRDKETEENRLKYALQAILGEDYKKIKGDPQGKKQKSFDDRHLVYWMVAQEMRTNRVTADIATHPMSSRGAPETPGLELLGRPYAEPYEDFTGLARQALKIFGRNTITSEKSQIDRLRKDFEENLSQYKNDLRYASVYPHYMDQDRLEKASVHLKEIEIDIRLPDTPHAFWWVSGPD